MYRINSPRIDTRVGTGEAAVFGSTVNPYIGEFAGAVAYNSKGAKKKRKVAGAQQKLEDTEIDYDDLTLGIALGIKEKEKELYEWATDPKNVQSESYTEELNKQLEDLLFTAQQGKTASKIAFERVKEVKKDDPYNYSQEELDYISKAVSDPNFGMNDSGERLPLNDIIAQTYLAADIQKQYEDEFEMPDYSKYTRGVNYEDKRGTKHSSVEKKVLTDEGVELIRQDAVQTYLAGKNTAEGTAIKRDRAAETLYKDIKNDFVEEKQREIAALGNDVEKIQALEQEYFVNRYLKKAREDAESEVRGTTLVDPKEDKEGSNPKYTEESITFGGKMNVPGYTVNEDGERIATNNEGTPISREIPLHKEMSIKDPISTIIPISTDILTLKDGKVVQPTKKNVGAINMNLGSIVTFDAWKEGTKAKSDKENFSGTPVLDGQREATKDAEKFIEQKSFVVATDDGDPPTTYLIPLEKVRSVLEEKKVPVDMYLNAGKKETEESVIDDDFLNSIGAEIRP